MIRLAASMAWFNSEPQNVEYRTAELRRVVSLRSVITIKSKEYIPSTFDIYFFYILRKAEVSFSIKLKLAASPVSGELH